VPAEADRSLRFWIPFRAETLPVLLWLSPEAEASGSAGLLDEACRSLQKLGASPLRPHGGGFVSRPRLHLSRSSLAVRSGSVSGRSLVVRPEGRPTRPQLEPVMVNRVVKAESACG
jgi:hypothetical protein